MIKRVLICCMGFAICSVSLAYGDSVAVSKEPYEEVKGFEFVFDRIGSCINEQDWSDDPKFSFKSNGSRYVRIGVADKDQNVPFEKEITLATCEGWPEGDKQAVGRVSNNPITIEYNLNKIYLGRFDGYVGMWNGYEPAFGKFTAANGEEKEVSVCNASGNSRKIYKLIKLSAKGSESSIALIESENKAKADAEVAGKAYDKKKNAEDKVKYARLLKQFRKQATLGTSVRVVTNDTQAQGTITKDKGKMVEVQYTMMVLYSKWQRINPYKEWVSRDRLIKPETNSWVLH